jgi:Mg2+/Co2+ transporter CorB
MTAASRAACTSWSARATGRQAGQPLLSDQETMIGAVLLGNNLINIGPRP